MANLCLHEGKKNGGKIFLQAFFKGKMTNALVSIVFNSTLANGVVRANGAKAIVQNYNCTVRV